MGGAYESRIIQILIFSSTLPGGVVGHNIDRCMKYHKTTTFRLTYHVLVCDCI